MPANASIPAFDPLNIPIAGTNLIEASAGTGKTYGIAALFTRLVVLEQMPVESILTVTFTKAATAEFENPFARTFGRSIAGFGERGGYGQSFRRP